MRLADYSSLLNLSVRAHTVPPDKNRSQYECFDCGMSGLHGGKRCGSRQPIDEKPNSGVVSGVPALNESVSLPVCSVLRRGRCRSQFTEERACDRPAVTPHLSADSVGEITWHTGNG